MSGANDPSPLDSILDTQACLGWARVVAQQLGAKYKPAAAAAAVLREVGHALSQAAKGLQTGGNTPEKMLAFAAALTSEAEALERASSRPVSLTGNGSAGGK